MDNGPNSETEDDIGNVSMDYMQSTGSIRGKRAIFLIGPSGSGKTAVAKRLAPAIGWTLVDTDSMVLEESGRESIGDIFDIDGESRFRDMEMACLRDVGHLRGGVVVATGGGLPASVGALEFMHRIGVTVYPKASVSTLWRRLSVNPGELTQRPLLRDGGESRLAEIVASRKQTYNRANFVVDTDSLDLSDLLEILKGITRQLQS